MSTPGNVWDSAWNGNFATSPFPLSGFTLGPQAAITVMNRIYVVAPTAGPFGAQNNVIGTILSATVNGPNVGSWRYESPIQANTIDGFGIAQPFVDTCNPGALAYGVGHLFALGQKAIYAAPINADGSLGGWTLWTATTSGAGDTMVGWQRIQGGAGLIVSYGGLGGANTPVNTFLVNADGSFGGLTSQLGLTGFNRRYGALMVDANNFLYYMGGEDTATSTPSNVVAYAPLNLATGALSAWTQAGANLPAARSRFGFTYVYSPSAFWPNGNNIESSAILMGGVATAGGAAQSTVYTQTGSGIRTAAVWVTYPNAMPTVARGNAAALTGSEDTPIPVSPGAPQPGYNFSPWSAQGFESAVDATRGFAYVVSIGGNNTTDVQATTLGPANLGGTGPFYKGAQSTLASAALGNGGVVALNADGFSYDITFPLGGKDVTGFGVPMHVGTFLDGDLVQLYVQVADSQSGDVSTSVPTIIKIGQAPTISALAATPATSSGRPVLSFKFGRGLGGAQQATYRIWVVRNSDVATLFDTGVVQGTDNLAQVLTAPMLVNVAHTVHAIATSFDSPITGATNSSPDTTLALTPTTAAAPGVPSGVSVSAVPLSGWNLLNWTNAASTTENRIYYRLHAGPGPWVLLVKDLLLGVGAQSAKLMDRIPYGVSLDFAVSAIAANSESALSSVVTTTLSPPADSPWAFLHLAGQPLTGAVGMVIPLQSWPTLQINYGSRIVPLWGRAQPIGKQGVLDYLSVDFELVSVNRANLPTVQQLTAALVAGGVAYFRDRVGNCFPVVLNTPEDIKFTFPGHELLGFHLVQTADTYAPFVRSGSAVGISTLVGGSAQPLSPTEWVA